MIRGLRLQTKVALVPPAVMLTEGCSDAEAGGDCNHRFRATETSRLYEHLTNDNVNGQRGQHATYGGQAGHQRLPGGRRCYRPLILQVTRQISRRN